MRITTWFGTILAGLLLLITACGVSDGNGNDNSRKPNASSSTSQEPTARPMAKMPAGTKLSLKRQGQLTVCEGNAGAPFLSAKKGMEAGHGLNGMDEGFDVDMLVLLGQRLGVQPVVVEAPNTTWLLDGTVLDKGVCDVIAGMSMDDPKYFPKMSASMGYFTKDTAILTKGNQSYKSLDLLAGKAVGAQTISPDFPDELDTYNSQHGNAIKVQRGMIDGLVAQLTAGTLDAVVMGNAQAMHFAVENKDLQVAGEFGHTYQERFAVQKGNTTLLEQVNDALKDAYSNGQYAKSYREWFGTDPSTPLTE